MQTKVIKNYPGKRPQTVCVRSISRKSRDLDALHVVTVAMVGREGRTDGRTEGGREGVRACVRAGGQAGGRAGGREGGSE